MDEATRERILNLDQTRDVILERFALAAEYHEDDTGQHTQRVGAIAARIAAILGLEQSEVELVRQAALLHDVGKAGVPDAVLLKQGRLVADEVTLMQRHTTIGAQILSGTRIRSLQLAEEIAFTHHEQWSGAGYPRGLVGDAIPLGGRIVAVADVFDALTHQRSYRPAWPVPEAVAEIRRQSGQHFDPRIVAAFLQLHGTEPVPTPSAPTSTASSGSTRTVLYIDDTLSNLEFVERILTHHSKNVTRSRTTLTGRILGEQPTITLLTAMDGLSGLALARQHHLDLILLDLNLPDIGGEDVLRALRDDPETRSIPVAILSADNSRARMQRLLTAGAQAYLIKPLDLKDFTDMLSSVFK